MTRWNRLIPRTLAAAAAFLGVQHASAQVPVRDVLVPADGPVVAQVAPVEILTPTSAATTASAVPAAAPVAPTGPMKVVESSGGGGCQTCTPFNFKKVPPVRTFPRPGFFPIPPSGKGAYNLLAAVQGKSLDAPPKFGYPPFALMPPSFFDADWRYLDDPKTPPKDKLEELKRIRVGDDWLVSTGGQLWSRYMNEYNSRLTQRDNVYQLSRFRPYVDIWYQDRFRLFAEANVSYTQWNDLPPLGIDESGPDIQNLFVDVKLGEVQKAPVYLRAGRQELLLGSQRLVSTLDWGNTRRTFQGLRLLRTGEKLDSDFFVVQPVVPNANRLDSGDNNQVFAGTFHTYRPKKGQAIDAYYLMLDNTNRVAQQGIQRQPSTVHTIGARYYGDKDLNDKQKLLWDFEGAYQFGERGRQDIQAGMLNASLGMNFKKAPLNPTIWVNYEYASGDDSVNGGDHFTTFNQLFPFGHYYMGWADLVGRQNIHDLSVTTYMYPAKWLTINMQYHNFWLDNVRDGLYNVAGNAVRRDATGRASTYVGHEIDLITNFHLTRRADLLVGYSYLFGGGFLKATSAPNAAVNSSLMYAMYSYRY
jgi:hypothetical protein